MKSWIETDLYENTSDFYEPTKVPDLGGYETDPDVAKSVMDKGDGTCLSRVAGPRAKVRDIERATAPNPQTDDQAREIIQENHPNSDLENVDVPDLELDSMLEAEGLDPTDVRSDFQVPTEGSQVLQDQELHAMEVVAQKRDVEIPDKDKIKRGEGKAHENAMKKLRKGKP